MNRWISINIIEERSEVWVWIENIGRNWEKGGIGVNLIGKIGIVWIM
jgi:hypothetical protein